MRTFSILALAALTACSSPHAPIARSASPSPSPALPSLVINAVGSAKRPVRIVQQRGNIREYELLARSFRSVGAPNDARVRLHDVRVTFTGAAGSQLVARAPEALVDERDGSITMFGGVRAENKAGERLSCRTLVYRRGTQSLHGSGSVLLQNNHGLRAVGETVDANIALSNVEMR